MKREHTSCGRCMTLRYLAQNTSLGPRAYFASPRKECERPPVPPPPLCADCGEVLPGAKEQHLCPAQRGGSCASCRVPLGAGGCGRCRAARRRKACVQCAVPMFGSGERCTRCIGLNLAQTLRRLDEVVEQKKVAEPALGRIAAVALEAFDGESQRDFEPRMLPETPVRRMELD